MKKECELCNLPAKAYCESDEASLCWNCDWKIHSANFLVAKHERSLLCHICQFPTQWKSSGSKLGSTLSICESCVKNNSKRRSLVQVHQTNQEQDEQDESEGDNEEGSEDSEDNHVVPRKTADQTSSSSSSKLNSEEESSSSSIKAVSMKRMRDNNEEDLDNQDDMCCSSSSSGNNEEEVTSLNCLRPLKQRKIDEEELIFSRVNQSESKSDLLVQSLKKFHQEMLLVQ